ncbi:MAG: hypothetical protein M3112_10310 [Actinomycetia bacterium]|nr:hypothetical protein [Actinomycetes bacterium]
MSQVFSGSMLLPGEDGDGLHATLEIDEELIRLTSGEDELGSWSRADCDVSPSGKGSFQLDLAGDNLEFTPSSPSAFAETMTVPLAPEPQSDENSERPRFDYDAAIDEIIANVKPLRDPNDDDEILSKPMLVGIVGVSTAVMAGLVTISMAL